MAAKQPSIQPPPDVWLAELELDVDMLYEEMRKQVPAPQLDQVQTLQARVDQMQELQVHLQFIQEQVAPDDVTPLQLTGRAAGTPQHLSNIVAAQLKQAQIRVFCIKADILKTLLQMLATQATLQSELQAAQAHAQMIRQQIQQHAQERTHMMRGLFGDDIEIKDSMVKDVGVRSDGGKSAFISLWDMPKLPGLKQLRFEDMIGSVTEWQREDWQQEQQQQQPVVGRMLHQHAQTLDTIYACTRYPLMADELPSDLPACISLSVTVNHFVLRHLSACRMPKLEVLQLYVPSLYGLTVQHFAWLKERAVVAGGKLHSLFLFGMCNDAVQQELSNRQLGWRVFLDELERIGIYVYLGTTIDY